MEFICEQCGNSFATMAKLYTHRNVHQPGNTPAVVEKPVIKSQPPTAEELQSVKSAVEKKPIELVYKYLGNCENCGRAVDTIEVQMDDGYMFVIAYCPSCKRQFNKEKVTPIMNQKVGFVTSVQPEKKKPR